MEQLSEARFGVLHGERLLDLAEIEALTITELACELDKSQAWLSRVIQGELSLSLSVASRAADVFGVPIEFFSVNRLPQENAVVTWRKLASSTKRMDKQIAGIFREAARLWRVTSEKSGYKTACLPTPADFDDDMESVATAVRVLGGVGEVEPIRNMVRFVERLGVGVISPLNRLDVCDGKHSGISRPSRYETRPLVCCVGQLNGAVQRLTIAHELGHLIYDLDLCAQPKPRGLEESRAFDFAGALLVPAGVMRSSITETTPLTSFLRLKARYGISAAALVKRANRLGIISSQRQRALFIQISSRGWRNQEPVNVPVETPQLLAQALKKAWPNRTIDMASRATGVKATHIASWANLPYHQPGSNNVVKFPKLSTPSPTGVL